MFGRLPNITGHIHDSYGGYITDNNVSSTGALTAVRNKQVVLGGDGPQYRSDLSFDASKSSTIFNGQTVQPRASQVLMIIKV